jgi:hypothetical protein
MQSVVDGTSCRTSSGVDDVSARQALILLGNEESDAAPNRPDRQTCLPAWGKRAADGLTSVALRPPSVTHSFPDVERGANQVRRRPFEWNSSKVVKGRAPRACAKARAGPHRLNPRNADQTEGSLFLERGSFERSMI